MFPSFGNLIMQFSGVSWTDLEEFRNYLEKRFDFEQVTVKKFRTWAERRQFNREMKRKQAESERPILPANQKLITLSVQDAPTKKGGPGLDCVHQQMEHVLVMSAQSVFMSCNAEATMFTVVSP